MIPRLHKRGQSFKGACGYILHDAKTTSHDRVLWTNKLNIFSHPDDAWFEMFSVARDQALIKELAGKDARGRKNTRPVLHYTLSWAASDNPSPEHMRETALSSLKALDLLGHQVLMAAHSDKEHLHVHIVVNSIHPDTGLTAPSNTQRSASRGGPKPMSANTGSIVMSGSRTTQNARVSRQNVSATASRSRRRPATRRMPGLPMCR
ncbi:MAG: relaxase/mobilization nuclease domain-containing protein [Hyphomicrobium sp.]|nr:relaxase/mobilization nuclease domain-containing protein [Hyphomicrobium sp.]